MTTCLLFALLHFQDQPYVRENISVTLRQFKIGARDDQGMPVKELQASDFRILLNGKEIVPVAFEEVDYIRPIKPQEVTGVAGDVVAPIEVVQDLSSTRESPRNIESQILKGNDHGVLEFYDSLVTAQRPARVRALIRDRASGLSGQLFHNCVDGVGGDRMVTRSGLAVDLFGKVASLGIIHQCLIQRFKEFTSSLSCEEVLAGG